MQPCPSCGFTQNRPGARFCSNCAAPLNPGAPIACPRCGMQNIPGAKFCSNCAAPLSYGTLAPAFPTPTALTGLLPANALLQSRYLILRKLGQGGMGAVYQANDTRLTGKLWAIKEMSDAQIADASERASAIAAFQREAQLLATLDHANLPKVSDFFQEAGKQYLVMDFVQGQTLEAVVEAAGGFLDQTTVLAWMEQLCDVLDYLHTRQPPIIFRDLKPANIMLTPENKIKLIDFGIARFFRPGKAKDTAQYGTMGYASPEQFGIGQTDARSDVYSLGVTLHHLLTKYDPSLTPFNLPPARNINPQVSANVEGVIVRATKANGIERFQTMREMKQALSSQAALISSLPVQQPVKPIAAQVTPYVFAPGKVAANVQELVQLCEQDWERAVEQFYSGYFAKWLESIGEFGLANEAKKRIGDRVENTMQAKLVLQDWLLQTGIKSIRPKLNLWPLKLEYELTTTHLSTQKAFRLGEINLQNTGGGILVARFEPQNPWITISPSGITCMRGEMSSTRVLFDPTIFTAKGRFTEEIAVVSNDTTERVMIEFRGTTAAGFVTSEEQIYLSAESSVVSFRVENLAPPTLQGMILTDKSWLVVKPETLRGDRMVVYVRLDITKRNPADWSATITIQSNKGIKTIPVHVKTA